MEERNDRSDPLCIIKFEDGTESEFGKYSDNFDNRSDTFTRKRKPTYESKKKSTAKRKITFKTPKNSVKRNCNAKLTKNMDGCSDDEEFLNGYGTSVRLDPNFQIHPSLSSYYSYVGTDEKTTGKHKILLTCKLCRKGNIKKADTGNWSNFLRHLDKVHQIQVRLSSTSFVIEYIQPIAELKNNSELQSLFDEAVVDLVAVDGLSINVTEGLAFRNLVQILNPRVTARTRKTVARHIKEKAAKEIDNARFESECILPKSAHIIVDIWSKFKNRTVLGVRLQYFNEQFQMHNSSLGFFSFAGRPVGVHIETKLKEILLSKSIRLDQIGCVFAGNASNMRSAFGMQIVSDERKVDNETELSLLEIEDQQSGDDDTDNESEDSSFDNFSELFDQTTNSEWQYHGCLSYQLQLVINSALKNNDEVFMIIKVTKKIIVHFQRSVYWANILEEKTGFSLRTEGSSRWDSIVTALETFCTKEFFATMQQVILTYNSHAESHEVISIPSFMTGPRLCELVKILLPFRRCANVLEGNSVTSCSVILCVLTLYNHCKKFQADEFPCFVVSLKKEIEKRFAKVMADKNWIVASFLDPRQKLRAFGTAVDEMTKMLPSKELVVAIVTDLLSNIRSEFNISSCNDDDLVGQTAKITKTTLPYIFCVLNEFAPKDEKLPKGEIEIYLSELVDDETADPLVFWQTNEKRFPALSILAKRYLAIPASSGDVERLFAVGGFLKRQSRNILKVKDVETLLLLHDVRLKELRRNFNTS